MDIEIIKFAINQSEAFSQASKIRYSVFVEEQHVPEELEYDGFEAESQHYLLFLNEKAVATCRWRHTVKGIKLERFAVLPEYRGKGLGEVLVKHVLKEVANEGKSVYLHAQEQVVGFYAKLGFSVYGDVFIEADIRHFLMKYEN